MTTTCSRYMAFSESERFVISPSLSPDREHGAGMRFLRASWRIRDTRTRRFFASRPPALPPSHRVPFIPRCSSRGGCDGNYGRRGKTVGELHERGMRAREAKATPLYKLATTARDRRREKSACVTVNCARVSVNMRRTIKEIAEDLAQRSRCISPNERSSVNAYKSFELSSYYMPLEIIGKSYYEIRIVSRYLK